MVILHFTWVSQLVRMRSRIADDDEDNVVEENVGSDQLNLLDLK